MEAILRAVLEIEEQARAIVDQAEREANEIAAGAGAEAAELRRQEAHAAEAEAEWIRTTARQEAEETRRRILATAQAEARRLAEEAGPRMEGAVAWVVGRVLDA